MQSEDALFDIDSLMEGHTMKNIGDYYYDSTGLCPVCGAGLVPVPIFSASVLNTHVSYNQQNINTKVKTTTTTYTGIQPMFVGYCLECDKRVHEAKEDEKAAAKPKSALLVTSIVCALLIIPGILGFLRLPNSSDQLGLWGSIGMIVLGLCLILGLPIASIATLVSYIQSIRQRKKYDSGWREPFTPRTEESLSHWAAYYMKKQPSNLTYLSIDEVKKMQNPLYGR